MKDITTVQKKEIISYSALRTQQIKALERKKMPEPGALKPTSPPVNWEANNTDILANHLPEVLGQKEVII